MLKNPHRPGIKQGADSETPKLPPPCTGEKGRIRARTEPGGCGEQSATAASSGAVPSLRRRCAAPGVDASAGAWSPRLPVRDP